MAPELLPQIGVLAVGGLVGGLALLVRGIGGHRTATRLGDTSTSSIATLAAGEVRISGVVEPAELMLISPLQSVPCVFYRSRIRERNDGDGSDGFEEERAVGFRVRDGGGSIRVFPRGAAFDVADRLDESTGLFDDTPAGVRLRTGSAYGGGALAGGADPASAPSPDPFAGFGRATTAARSARRYTEARIEPGEAVTVLGRAIPFGQLDDPDGADVAEGHAPIAADDPEVTADIAAARAAGLLADDAEDAWGNAAIPGFGIGRPTRPPELNPAATALPLASGAQAEHTARTFEIDPDTLVLASSVDVPLLVAAGIPGAAVARHEARFLVGLLGAALAIVSAVVLALAVSGGLDVVLGAGP
jgi:hypothetical protein